MLVHRLLTISLKEQEKTRELLHGLDYSEYAADVSTKTYNAKRASKDCEHLFHCLILKDHGMRVYEALIFDVEYNTVSLYIHELNMHLHYKLRQDKRIDETTFIEEEHKLGVYFRQPMVLCDGVRPFQGDQTLSKSSFKRKQEQQTAKNVGPTSIVSLASELLAKTEHVTQSEPSLSQTCEFKVFDRINVRLATTDSFPLDLQIKLQLNEQDAEEFAQIKEA